jgi:DNA ligase-associated metallophosphoesterase
LEKAQLKIGNTELTLLSGKALLLNNSQTLVISDLHLGKAGHFRKFGIPISKEVHQTDLSLLSNLVTKHHIKQLLIIGDLFHSDLNNEWDLFVNFIKAHSHVKPVLVAGNHDKYTKSALKEVLTVHEEKYNLNDIIFTHEPMELTKIKTGEYNICGHIHPAIILKGKGRQSMKLPCFYFGEKQGIIPAFGKFTGSALITPKQHDRVFVVTGNHVIPVN